RTVSSPGSPGPAPTRYTVTIPPFPSLLCRSLADIPPRTCTERRWGSWEEGRSAAPVEEVTGHGAAEGHGVVAFHRVTQDDVAVERGDHPPQSPVDRIRAHRKVAPAAQLVEEGSFAVHRPPARGVVDGGQQRRRRRVVGP